MRCPKCGYVSFPGLAQCKKCGQLLPNRSVSSASRVAQRAEAPAQPVQPNSTDSKAVPTPSVHLPPSAVEPKAPPAASREPSPAPAANDQWRDEVAARVQDFRRRRGQAAGVEKDENLKFDFDVAQPARDVAAEKIIEFPQSQFEAEIQEPENALAFGEFADLPPLSESPAEVASERAESSSAKMEFEPLEVEFESRSAEDTAALAAHTPFPYPVASLGDRLLAGLGDALILLIAAGIFAGIFAAAHGRLKPTSLNFAVTGFIAALFVLVYFGVFASMTCTTPGMLWKGLEIRTFEGRLPSPQDSFWRALGYLVSGGALWLGFVWAAVDPDRLTWHDRMSRTFITGSDAVSAEDEPRI